VEVKVREYISSRACPRILFLLGLCDLVVILGPPIKLWRFLKHEAFVTISWEPLIELWIVSQALCGFGDHPQGSIVDQGLPF
jgi:hypothetical protein